MNRQILRDTKTELVAGIISDHVPNRIGRLLVVGCGTGIEAAILAAQLRANVIGIDVVDEFADEALASADLRLGDATELAFDDDFFDFVYSYHALEHIPDPDQALHEMSRVLRPGGSYWIGTPNRTRALGYIGSNDATFREKFAWNFIDWKARLMGKFRNEFGAHAGFSHSELKQMLAKHFSTVSGMSDTYYSTLYRKHEGKLAMIRKLRISAVTYPSVYFMGTK